MTWCNSGRSLPQTIHAACTKPRVQVSEYRESLGVAGDELSARHHERLEVNKVLVNAGRKHRIIFDLRLKTGYPAGARDILLVHQKMPENFGSVLL